MQSAKVSGLVYLARERRKRLCQPTVPRELHSWLPIASLPLWAGPPDAEALRPRPRHPWEDERLSEQQDKVTSEGGGESALVPTLPPTGKGFQASRLPSLGLTATSLSEGSQGRARRSSLASGLRLKSLSGFSTRRALDPLQPQPSFRLCPCLSYLFPL